MKSIGVIGNVVLVVVIHCLWDKCRSAAENLRLSWLLFRFLFLPRNMTRRPSAIGQTVADAPVVQLLCRSAPPSKMTGEPARAAAEARPRGDIAGLSQSDASGRRRRGRFAHVQAGRAESGRGWTAPGQTAGPGAKSAPRRSRWNEKGKIN
jgi:hypothetical protein